MANNQVYQLWLTGILDKQLRCRAFTSLPLQPYTYSNLNNACATWLSAGYLNVDQNPVEIVTGDLLATVVSVTFTPTNNAPSQITIYGRFFDSLYAPGVNCGFTFEQQPLTFSSGQPITFSMGVLATDAGWEGASGS